MTEVRLQEYVQQIDGLVEKGQYDEALAHLRHILQHYPKFLHAYRLLGKTLLETGQDDAAEEMFQRVLSGDPEDFVARVGLSVIYDRQGDLRRAIWHMERAFELAPDNDVIQEELRRLYGRRDGVVPPRVMLTRGALARMYARGGLFSRAVETFRSLLAEEPERVDLRVALAEALWNDGQRVQAEEVCLRVLDELPYCLKANLILGEIWTRSGREEAQVHLRRAEAVDPENGRAVEVLGDASPLSPREVYLPYLEYGAPGIPTERPAVGVPVLEEQALVDLERAAEIQIEIPAWLEEIGLGEEGIPSVVEEEGIAVPAWLMPEETAPEVIAPLEVPAPAEIPEWLRAAAPPEVTPPEAPVPAEIPEWLRELAPPEVAAPEEPEWREEIRELVREVPMPEMPEVPEVPEVEELPEWPEETAPPEAVPELEIPEWLEEVIPPEVPRAEVPPAEPEVFGWTAFGAEEEIFQPPSPVVEVPPPEQPFGWTAFGEEVVAPEVPPEVPAWREPEMPAVEVSPPPAPAPEAAVPPEIIPPTVVPPEAVAPPPPPPTRPEVVPTPPPAAEAMASVEVLRAHVRARPRDYAARLNLARALWQAGLYADSLEAYSQLLRTGKFVDEVLADMEAHVTERPNDPAARRVLGDAYMRADRLAEALAEYRTALDLLK